MVHIKPSNIVDLFSGVGGLSLGAARAGFFVRGAVDLDSHANTAHQRNFPRTLHLNTDITKLSGKSLRHGLHLSGESITGIIGGPPCQGFSSMGTRDKNDTRNLSFIEFFRIVSELMPKFFFVENVLGIMRSSYDEIRDLAFSHVDANYIMLPALYLAANDYGAPTSRKRVFFIGYHAGEMDPLTSNSFDAPSNVETVLVKHALYGLPTRINPCWQSEKESWQVVDTYLEGNFGQRLYGFVPAGVGDRKSLHRLLNSKEVSGCLGTAHSTAVAHRYANTARGRYDPISRACRLDPDNFCPTLRAGTGPDRGSYQAVRPIHPSQARVITPREGARLQGFPDWFQFAPTKWHSFRQIGNSVSPILAEHVLGVIAKALGISSPLRESNE